MGVEETKYPPIIDIMEEVDSTSFALWEILGGEGYDT